jgi:hypothetical protein
MKSCQLSAISRQPLAGGTAVIYSDLLVGNHKADS